MTLTRNWLQDDLDGTGIERQDIAPVAGGEEAAQDAGAGDVVPVDGSAPVAAPSRARASNLGEDGSRSRDLVALYFRQMGAVELLSRADELALAQRIEARQRAMLEGLSRVPMLVERIGRWADEVRQGSRDLRTLLDLSEIDTAAEPGQDGMTEDEDLPGDAEAVGGEPQLPPEAMARLSGFAELGREIVSLSAKRMAAVARGRALARRDRTRLDDLLARAAREIGLLRLHADRIADLVAMIEGEHRQLERIERAAATDGRREALAAFALRVGLPAPELREAVVLVRQAQREVRRAREEILRAHLPLVVAIAKRYRGKSSLDLLDLIQEGNLGLMHAIEKYDHRRGVKVSTYAVWWIRQAMARAMADQGRLIRVPVHMTESVAKVMRERHKLAHKLGRSPETEEIATAVAMSAARVEKALSLVREPLSLDVPVGEDGDATLGDLIEAPDAVDPHAVAEAGALKESIAEALAGLSEREQRILRMRFGIGGMAEHTLAEVGEAFGLTRERIRQIEANALAKLRRPGRGGRKLLAFAQA
jgi:RNA polymerase primary sigma factor